MSFHTKWESGQLLSRATQDLSAIRRFSGFGLVFLVLNILQVTVVTGVLLHMYWPLGLVVAATAVPVVWLSMRFEKEYVVVSRRVQDEQGDLATLAEEGAVGIRMIKSFGRSEHMSEQYDAAARKLHAHLDGQGPALGEVLDLPRGDPQHRGGDRAAARRDRRRPGLPHPRRAGRVHHPAALAGLAGGLAGRDPGDGAGVDDRQRPDPGDLRHRARPSSAAPAPIAAPRGHLRLEGVEFAFPDARPGTPVLRGVDLDIEPGETVALVGATGSGKTVLTALVPRLYDVTGGRVHHRRRRRPRARPAPPAVAGRDRVRGPDPVLDERPGEPHPGPRPGDRPGHRGRDRAGAGHRPGRLRPRPALGARHPDRRAGPGALRWPAPAARAGPGGARPPADPRARRHPVRARRAHREAGRGGPAPGCSPTPPG